jgi:hypothetical protein
MIQLQMLIYIVSGAYYKWKEDRMTLKQYVKRLKDSGHTKTIFDCDGHTIVIQSHNHIEDNSA